MCVSERSICSLGLVGRAGPEGEEGRGGGVSGYVGASLIAQLVKNLPAMQETPVRFLGWENPLEKG